jgi:hypothetical protein
MLLVRSMASLRAWLRWLVPRRPDHRVREIRRAQVHCPHTGQAVEIDLLVHDTGEEHAVLRCSFHPDVPPRCDQACRKLAEAVVGPARAVIICPPGSGPPEEID